MALHKGGRDTHRYNEDAGPLGGGGVVSLLEPEELAAVVVMVLAVIRGGIPTPGKAVGFEPDITIALSS